MTTPKSCCCSAPKPLPGVAAAGAHSQQNRLIDPVCGMSVSRDSVHHSEHAGRPYAFCSSACRTEFDAEPGRYVDEHGEPRAGKGHSASVAHDHHTHE